MISVGWTSVVVLLALILFLRDQSNMLGVFGSYFFTMIADAKGLIDSNDKTIPAYGIMFVSTIFTSVWMILILLSTTALKMLAPVHRFTAWFFDVEKHPVQALGIVAGALVMIGSLIWTVLRAMI